MKNKEKFLALISDKDNSTLEQVEYRIKNRDMLKESQKIAIKILLRLDELGWKQKDLAQEMKVTPQQISKIVSGKENMGIETQIRLQSILDIPILASYYEDRRNNYAEIAKIQSGAKLEYGLPIEPVDKFDRLASQVVMAVVYNGFNDNKAA